MAIKEKVRKEMFLPLLLFLLVFTIDKIVLKFAGIALLYLLHPDFHFRKNARRIPLFYLLLIALEILKFLLLNRDFSQGHTVAFLLGCLFWMVSFLSLYQMRSIVDKIDRERVYRTLTVFFLINAGISLLNLLLTMYRAGSLNPYGMVDSEYGSSTGDLIKGLFQGPSYLNMMINSFFLFFFLYRGKLSLALTAVIVVLVTTANFANLVLVPVLVASLIFNKDKKMRWSVAGFLALFVVFYLLVTPSNLHYLKNSLFVPKKQVEELIAYEKKAIAKPAADGKKPVYTAAKVDVLLSQEALSIPDTMVTINGRSGKLQSFSQTAQYLKTGPKAFLFGAGIGNFSSFLALRMSDLDKEDGSRLFTYLPTYMAPEFQANHYKIYRAIYSLPQEFHSIKQFPNSFLNQLFGEYGLAGVLLFLLTYVLFFFRHFRKLTYGKYLLFLLGGYLLFDYLFEYLSVVTVFELLMFCDIHRLESAGQAVVPLQAEQS